MLSKVKSLLSSKVFGSILQQKIERLMTFINNYIISSLYVTAGQQVRALAAQLRAPGFCHNHKGYSNSKHFIQVSGIIW